VDDRLTKIQKLLDVSEGNLQTARNLLREYLNQAPKDSLDVGTKLREMGFAGSDTAVNDSLNTEGTIVEGVFNGIEMIGPDGKAYTVPANYASKSKLVEGDGLKLTISEDGSYVFKQISPVERRNAIGTLSYNNGQYTVDAEGKTYRVLTASVTFYKAEPGDQVSIIIPREHDSAWATLENVIKKQEVPTDIQNPPEPQIIMPENSVKITAVDYDNETTEPVVAPISEAPVANKLVVNDLDNPAEPNIVPETPSSEPVINQSVETQPEILMPEEISQQPGNNNPEISVEPEIATPEDTYSPAVPTPAPAPNQDLGPEIEFPAGPSLSDDEILAKLKANIAGNQQVVANIQTNPAPLPTNEVAADLEKIMNQQQQQSQPQPQDNSDRPISELDI
jgi:hypothetical protein